MESDNGIRLVERNDAPEEVAGVYDEILATREGEMGDDLALNGLWQAYGNAPDLLRIVWAHMHESYRGGTLPFEMASKISLVTATVLDCEGCRFFHTERLEAAGVDDGEIERMREREIDASAFSREEFEVLRFTERAAADPTGIDRADVERLRDVGLSEKAIVEVIDCIALHYHTWFVQETIGVGHDTTPGTDEAFLGAEGME